MLASIIDSVAWSTCLLVDEGDFIIATFSSFVKLGNWDFLVSGATVVPSPSVFVSTTFGFLNLLKIPFFSLTPKASKKLSTSNVPLKSISTSPLLALSTAPWNNLPNTPFIPGSLLRSTLPSATFSKKLEINSS